MFHIPLDAFNDYDDNAEIKGFIEKASIEVYEKDDPEAKHEGYIIYDTPSMVLKEWDKENSELCGEILMKDHSIIKLTKKQVEFFKKHCTN